MSKRITSLDNKEIKNIIRLTNKSRLRNESKLFVVEGLRELRMANSNGFNIKKLFCNTNIVNLESVKSEFKSEIIEVNNIANVFQVFEYWFWPKILDKKLMPFKI